MVTKLLTGNEALALGALHAGIKVATGYPGTPSTGALTSLLEMQPPDVHVEWITNEKVAFEIAAAAAWAGQRALCTMKMSGLNVAYDSLVSAAHSGVTGGLVVFDPNREFTIRAENQHSNVGYTLYEGRTVLGWPELSFQRGKPILRNGEIVAERGQGRFLPTLETPAESL